MVSVALPPGDSVPTCAATPAVPGASANVTAPSGLPAAQASAAVPVFVSVSATAPLPWQSGAEIASTPSVVAPLGVGIAVAVGVATGRARAAFAGANRLDAKPSQAGAWPVATGIDARSRRRSHDQQHGHR